MYKEHIKLSILITFILTMIISTSVFASTNQTRLSGSDRYETSSKIALNGWTQSDYAVLALGKDYPDALCAAPLAGKYKAPILLTESDSIPASVLSTIQQLKVKNIFIIGGTGVISKAVQDQLTALGVTTSRLAGENRYDTAIAVAKQLGSISQIAIVTGEDYSDALSMSPIAAKLNMPIILVEKDSIPQSVKDYVASKSITKTYVVGKGTSINNVAGLTNVTEINGTDKYIRNITILNTFKSSIDFSTIYLATGENFADSLCGSAISGKNGNGLLLVGKDINKQSDFIQLVAPNANIRILGGEGAITDSTVDGVVNSAPTTINPLGVSEISMISTKLTKTGTNTATFKYKVLNKSGKEITNTIPISEIHTAASLASTITLDPSTATGTITYNSSTDIDKIITISLIDFNGIVGVATYSSGELQLRDPSEVFSINLGSTILKKTGTNTATFEYRIENNLAAEITKAIPASQITASASVSSTIALNPSEGLGTITFNSATDIEKPIVITLVDKLSGKTGSLTLYANQSETRKIAKINVTSSSLGWVDSAEGPVGYATYTVYDQYGNMINSESALNNNLSFKSQGATVTGRNGLLTLRYLKGIDMTQRESEIITITDTTTGVSTIATLKIALRAK